MFRIKIRGIYSTALTKLLLDHKKSLDKRNSIDLLDQGFEIVQPSVTVEERFGLKGNYETPDLEVYDRQDSQGVQASGTFAAAKALTIILQDCLDDVIIRPIQALVPSVGSLCVDMEFPHLSKRKLDETRGSIITTLEGHHHYKACGGEVSSAVDMAEKLLEGGGPRKEVKGLLEQAVRMEYPKVGSLIEIEHVKLHGEVFYLGKAIVEVLNNSNSVIQFRRVFETKGIYDGLKVAKDPGDYAVTEAKIGEWYFKTRYFSKKGMYKGTYININTPIELYPHGIRYVDLEVDICSWPNGRVKKLDEKRLKEAAAEGIVTAKILKTVKEKMREIILTLKKSD
jgi:protein associated with RNAse G/E